jgi:hypothetical protein
MMALRSIARQAPGWMAWVVLLLPVPALADDLPSFRLDMKDGVLTPSRLEVPARQRFKIVLSNSGKGPAEFESLPLRKEKVLAPGVTSFVVFQSLSAGEYPFFDEFHAGARGVIVAR